MKIKLSLLVVLMAALNASSIAQNFLTKVDKKHSLELAHYAIKEDKKEGFAELKEKTFEALSKQPGFVNVYSYQDINKPNEFVDIVIWETIDNAKGAEQKFITLPEFNAYNASLEKVILYSHGDLLPDGELVKSGINENSIMEFVAYTIRDGQLDNYKEARTTVFNTLSNKYDGFQSSRTWQSVEQPKMVMDVVFWKDLTTAQKAFKESSTTPEFQPFNMTLERLLYFGDYKQVY